MALHKGDPGNQEMLERNRPPYRADHVGGFIRPNALTQALDQYDKGELPEATIAKIQQRAIRDIVTLQEDLGYRVVTHSEFNRRGWRIRTSCSRSRMSRWSPPRFR